MSSFTFTFTSNIPLDLIKSFKMSSGPGAAILLYSPSWSHNYREDL